VICPSCGKQNADDTKFCNFCGRSLVNPKEPRKCPACGKENASYLMYCGNCGSELPTVSIERKPIVDSKEPRKCPSCGKENASYVMYCGNCGTELPRVIMERRPETDAVPASPAPSSSAVLAPSTTTTKTYCPNCGRLISIYDYQCPFCRSLTGQRERLEDDFFQREKTSGPTAAGIMMILVGVIAIGMGLLYLIAGASYVPQSSVDVNVQGIIGCCGALELMFGLGSAAGGLFAIQRKHFVLALLGSIVGLLTIGPLFIGSILSLVSLILLAMAHEEFE
jgi:predicted RNA-binding Zn-ribbon protein involved in translation (DUF1610 family)